MASSSCMLMQNWGHCGAEIAHTDAELQACCKKPRLIEVVEE